MAAHLSNGRVNLLILREAFRRELLECMDRCVGSKAIVWDDTLTGPVGLIAEYSLLKEHEVDKMFPLQPGRLPVNTLHNIIFITRPKLSNMEIIAQNIHNEEKAGGSFRKDYHIYFVPQKSLLCERQLKDLGVYGTFTTVDEFSLDLIPLDSDLLSMELEDSFKDCYLNNDMSSMFYVAKSLMTLQSLYGTIPNISGKGICAKNVTDMMLRMRRELAGNQQQQISPQIDTLLLIDRNTDLLTPLLSQLTYEGLIDEFYGINNTTVKLPPEKFVRGKEGASTPDLPTEPKKIILNSGEELFAVLRDRNFHAVGPELSRRAKNLSAQVEERKDAKTVGEIKQFVSKLPHIQAAKTSLAIHTSIAELVKAVTDSDSFMEPLQIQQEFLNGIETDKINTQIEDSIAKKDPLIQVLRLVCLQSLTNNGLKPKIFDFYRKEILETYGYEQLLTLNNLERVGLLRVQSQKTYSTLRKSLRLIVEDVSEVNPGDISYVYSGYAPLTVRLAQFLARPGWRIIEEVLKLLPGPTIQEVQQIPMELRKKKPVNVDGESPPKVTMVFFLGGVTFAEIAALRFLSQMEEGPTDYIIATTKIINGITWMKSLMEDLQPPSF